MPVYASGRGPPSFACFAMIKVPFRTVKVPQRHSPPPGANGSSTAADDAGSDPVALAQIVRSAPDQAANSLVRTDTQDFNHPEVLRVFRDSVQAEDLQRVPLGQSHVAADGNL